MNNNQKKGKNNESRGGFGSKAKEEKDFEQVILDIARVTRVMAGGKRMRFRACLVIGDKKGRVGMAVAKAADVTLAVNKAFTKAKKNLINVAIYNDTIPHRVEVKYKAAHILLKPAPKGTGIIAGGAVRTVIDLSGISNIVAKILGSKNKINNANAALKALKMLKRVEPKPAKKVEIKEIENNK
jgi:small subunit ribosomal protein S5